MKFNTTKNMLTKNKKQTNKQKTSEGILSGKSFGKIQK